MPEPRRARKAKPPRRRAAQDAPGAARPPKPKRESRSLSARSLTALWFVAVLAAATALVADLTPLAVPSWVPVAGAVTVTTTYTLALGVRAGGRPGHRRHCSRSC